MRKTITTLLCILTLCFYGHQIKAQEKSSSPPFYIQDYQLGKGIRFSGPNGGYFMKIRSYVQSFAEVRTTNNWDDPEARFRVRRARFDVEGKSAKEKFSYRLRVDFAIPNNTDGDDLYSGTLLDAFITYRPTKNWKFTFGQRSTMTDNREMRIPSDQLQLVERSRVTSAFAAVRDFGLFIEGKERLGSWYVKPGVAITAGDGQNAFKNRGGLKYGGRIDFLPFGLFRNMGEFSEVDFARQLTPKLIFGAAYSYNVGISSRRGRGSGDIIYLGSDGVTEELPDYGKLCTDFMFKYQGWTVLGEFTWAYANVNSPDIFYRVRNDGSTANLRSDDGLNNASIIDYVAGRMMVGRGYNIQGGYLFKSGYSIDGRFTYLDPDNNSFLNNEQFYNRDKYYTLGFAKYLMSDAAKVQLSFTYVDALPGSKGSDGEVINADAELLGRLMFQVSF
ncbi:porin [Flammeovirga agarivorans]|uniref:Porin n=1 Tax=Flammeovirga agarivorans TaxID=2726742 RepID=A0A7X8SGW8_9BACT|nr:porin [Flammeovirga agarivorans]NLR89969.1 porin [Flammeovirga agarivorans]